MRRTVRRLLGIAAVVLALLIVWALFVPLADWLTQLTSKSRTHHLSCASADERRGSADCTIRRFLRQAQPGSSPSLEAPVRSALAGWLVTGSMWRLADGEHLGDQVVQRPG